MTGPPYPARPAIREQGGRFWATAAAVVLLALLFVVGFGYRAWVELEAQHAAVYSQHRDER